jgi:hypothetical protein
MAETQHPNAPNSPTPDERKALADVPKGTWALTLIAVRTMFAAWMALYVGRFLMQGPVS